MQFKKILTSNATMTIAFIFIFKYHVEVICSNYGPEVKIDPSLGVKIVYRNIKREHQTTSP